MTEFNKYIHLHTYIYTPTCSLFKNLAETFLIKNEMLEKVFQTLQRGCCCYWQQCKYSLWVHFTCYEHIYCTYWHRSMKFYESTISTIASAFSLSGHCNFWWSAGYRNLEWKKIIKHKCIYCRIVPQQDKAILIWSTFSLKVLNASHVLIYYNVIFTIVNNIYIYIHCIIIKYWQFLEIWLYLTV